MNYKDKRILVTGGAGFIGSEVVSQLLKKNAMVTVLDNFSSGKRQYLKNNKKNLKIIKGDITDEKIVSRSVKDQEYVIHLAALPFIPDSFYYPADFFNVNTTGSVNLLWKSMCLRRWPLLEKPKRPFNTESWRLFYLSRQQFDYPSRQVLMMDESHNVYNYEFHYL